MATELETRAPVQAGAEATSSRPADSISVIRPREPSLLYAYAELWRYRVYVLHFGRQLVRKRYMQTWLGFAWLPLRPALNVGTKLFVFGGLVGLSSGRTPYPVFFLTASAAWLLFSEILTWSTRSLYLARSQLRIVHVPRLVVIVSAVIPSLVDFLISLLMAAAALVYYLFRADTLYLTLSWRSPVYVLGGLLLLVLLGVGLGVVVAVAGTRARDIRFVLSYFVSFLYFLTPIIYSFDQIPNSYKPFAELNPLTGATELFKAGLFASERPSVEALTISLVAVALIWGPGLWLFHRQEVREW